MGAKGGSSQDGCWEQHGQGGKGIEAHHTGGGQADQHHEDAAGRPLGMQQPLRNIAAQQTPIAVSGPMAHPFSLSETCLHNPTAASEPSLGACSSLSRIHLHSPDAVSELSQGSGGSLEHEQPLRHKSAQHTPTAVGEPYHKVAVCPLSTRQPFRHISAQHIPTLQQSVNH